jgi:hypothetical protein
MPRMSDGTSRPNSLCHNLVQNTVSISPPTSIEVFLSLSTATRSSRVTPLIQVTLQQELNDSLTSNHSVLPEIQMDQPSPTLPNGLLSTRPDLKITNFVLVTLLKATTFLSYSVLTAKKDLTQPPDSPGLITQATTSLN